MFTGLDATASQELLVHLNRLAESNRTVVLTIHQPRFEIFHMFHKLVLLSDGRVREQFRRVHTVQLLLLPGVLTPLCSPQVAYHGAPQNAYAVFVEALTSRLYTKNMAIPEIEDKNPAGPTLSQLS